MILMYHNIGSDYEANALPIAYFEDHIAYLKSSRFTLVSLGDYIQNIQRQNPREDFISLTFDDAYASVYETVIPQLKLWNIPFSVFVPVDYVGQHNKWDMADGPDVSKIMTWQQLLDLSQEDLATIGSHGMSHTSFGDLDEAAINKELTTSKEILERKLNLTVSFFSYPYGQPKDLGARTASKLREHGYAAAVSTIWGKKNVIDDLYNLKRIEIEIADDGVSLKKKLESSTGLRLIKQTLKNNLYKIGLWG
ncbi:MAG: polysaccharide deacetylase family protein [Flavobacteriales bacterium]|nr:polysaccharide deacetylase family protein [Flavobacteriales bacterium]